MHNYSKRSQSIEPYGKYEKNHTCQKKTQFWILFTKANNCCQCIQVGTRVRSVSGYLVFPTRYIVFDM